MMLTVISSLPLLAATPYEEIAEVPERAAGIYHAYPVTSTHPTPPPAGFRPVYISHMGRHGSRYLLRDWEYDDMLKLLQSAHDAGVLTPAGEKVYADFQDVYAEADGHAGDLSPLGARQHKAIAERMFNAYPDVFCGSRRVNAVSTMIMRCGMSMAAFCEQLKVMNPLLEISRDPSQRHMRYIMYNSDDMKAYNSDSGPWKEEYRKLREKWIPTRRIINELFNDSVYISRHINPTEFVWSLYNVASNMQNVENPRPFIDLFTHDELYNL
ncbi:MAG: histidine phosphatase family protein, partial [Muribaculaceae bacterium]|nr:histidine phosphatase family protein [Muribaculaceae bacterium]